MPDSVMPPRTEPLVDEDGGRPYEELRKDPYFRMFCRGLSAVVYEKMKRDGTLPAWWRAPEPAAQEQQEGVME